MRAEREGGVLSVGAGLAVAVRAGERGSHDAATVTGTVPERAAPPVSAPANRAPLPTGSSADAEQSLRPMDAEILAAARAGMDRGKAKDIFPRAPYKVSLYEDDSKTWGNRVKVDLNGDQKWDEKWEFSASGDVRRQVAPADDEHYTEEYVLVGKSWVKCAR